MVYKFETLVQKPAQLFLIIVLTFFAYSNIFRGEFTADAVAYVLNWQTVRNVSVENIGKILTTESVPLDEKGVYRPVKSLFIMASHAVWGDRAFGYYLDAVFLHIANTLLVYLIVEQIALVMERNGSSGHHFKKRSTKVNLDSDSLNSGSLRPSLANKSNSNSQLNTSARSVMFLNWLPSLPFLTALLFGLHPIQTEAITLLTSSFDSLGWTFYLGSVAAYLYANSIRMKILRINANMMRIVSVVLAGLAFFTYELTLSLPVVIILIDLCFRSLSFPPFVRHSRESGNPLRVNSRESSNSSGSSIRSRMTSKRIVSLEVVPYFAILTFYLFVRFVLLHLGTRGSYLGDSFFKTQLVMTFAWVKYLWLLIWPANLTVDHKILPGIYSVVYKAYVSQGTLNSLSLVSPKVLLNLAILGSLAGVGIYFWRRLPIVAFCIFWIFITLSPAAFLLSQSSVMAERYEYMAVFGFSLLAAYLFSIWSRFLTKNNLHLPIFNEFSIKKKFSNIFIFVILVSLIGFYATKTFIRNKDYHDTLTFWQKLAVQSPDNAITNYTLAKIYTERQSYDLALNYYGKALEAQPGIVEVNYRIGKIYELLNQIDQANMYFNQALGTNNRYSAYSKFEILKLEEFEKAGYSFSRIPDAGGWSQMKINGVSFEYPNKWLVAESKSELVFDDSAESMSTQISIDKLLMSADKYMRSQSKLGELINEGPAQIPNISDAKVRVWDREGVQILEFFLFGGGRVVRVVAWPANSLAIADFKRLLASISYE